MTGGKVCGPIWVAMMDRILKSRNDWQMKFTVPSGITFRDICSRSGELVTDYCAASGDDIFTNAAFKTGTEPTSTCSFHGGGGSRSNRQANVDPESQYDMQGTRQNMPGTQQQPSYQQYYQQVQPQNSYYGYQ
jgi:membrane carboxypeptidase/penicillin-binding protein